LGKLEKINSSARAEAGPAYITREWTSVLHIISQMQWVSDPIAKERRLLGTVLRKEKVVRRK
jgi:hypothetical protein